MSGNVVVGSEGGSTVFWDIFLPTFAASFVVALLAGILLFIGQDRVYRCRERDRMAREVSAFKESLEFALMDLSGADTHGPELRIPYIARRLARIVSEAPVSEWHAHLKKEPLWPVLSEFKKAYRLSFSQESEIRKDIRSGSDPSGFATQLKESLPALVQRMYELRDCLDKRSD